MNMGDSLQNRVGQGDIKKGRLGTFAGVFTPSILTILGVILFLRLGYVVGNAGLGKALIIIGLANAISILTSLSLAAIATNLKVKGGGDYYLISRTLGVEFGGAIGTVLFLAQSVSIAFYCMGLGEAVGAILSAGWKLYPQVIAALAVAFLFIFAWLGADWATRFQYVVMAILFAALLSFFGGGFQLLDKAVFLDNWLAPQSGPPFWVLFAVFFPAVTGFTQGVSMSGDLKDPGRSIPSGTFLAVGLSIIVYVGAACLFASALPQTILAGDYGAMKKLASFGILIDAGVIAATLSSAMASFLGAPRILQSMAKDRVFPFLAPFTKGAGPTENPRRGVLLAGAIALATVGLGQLNLIAPIVAMFFLISYGLLNYATYFEARSSSPSFRPRFRWYNGRVSLVGFLTCLGAMLAIDLAAGMVALAVLFAVYQYLRRTAGPARWADSRRSYYLQRIRENLFAASAEPEHPRDWRPGILVFPESNKDCGYLLHFAAWLSERSGLAAVVRILEGEGLAILRRKEKSEKELTNMIADCGIQAFPLCVAAPNVQAGLNTLVQSFGIGPLRVNTLLLGWPDPLTRSILGYGPWRNVADLRGALHFGCNLILMNGEEKDRPAMESIQSGDRRIDVWWKGDSTSRLMLLLSYILTRDNAWEGSEIRVIAVRQKETTEEGIREFLKEVRIEAEPLIVADITAEAIVTHSADSTLVFLPFRLQGDQITDTLGQPLGDVLPHLPLTALVLAAEDIELDADPEEGQAGELAEAMDVLKDAQKKAQHIEKEANESNERVRQRMEALESALASGAGEGVMALVKEVLEAKDEANKMARRVAKATAKVNDAVREAERLGAHFEEEDQEPGNSPPEGQEKKEGDPRSTGHN